MNTLKNLEKSTLNNLLVLFIAGLLFWTSLTSLLPTLPAYIEEIGGSPQEVGLVMGSFAIGLLLCRSWLGKVADIRGRKLVMLIGTAVVGLAPLGYLWVDSIPLLAVMRAFHGVSIAAFTTAYSTLVVDLSPIRQRGELIGYMSLVAPIGMAIGPALGGYLEVSFGYTALFITAASAGLFAFLGTSQVREDKRSSVLDSLENSHTVNPRFWSLLMSPRLAIPAVILLLIGLVFGSLASFLPLFIRETNVEFNAGLYYTCAAIASFVVRVFAGRASDYYGRGVFITASLVSYGLAMMLLAIADTPIFFVLSAIFEGAGAGTLIPMIIALMSDRSTMNERGQVYAVCLGGFDVGLALAGPILGFVAQEFGYRAIFSLSAGLASVALAVFLTRSSKSLSHSLRFATGREKDYYALEIGSQYSN